MGIVSRVKQKLKSIFGHANAQIPPSAESEENQVKRAKSIVRILRQRVQDSLRKADYSATLIDVKRLYKIAWVSISSTRFDTDLDATLHAVGTSVSSAYRPSGNRRVLYLTSGLLETGGLSQHLLNNLRYHNREYYDILVCSTEQFGPSNLTGERVREVMSLAEVHVLPQPDNLMDSMLDLRAYIEAQQVDVIAYMTSPHDVIAIATASVFPHVPSVFLNSSHHVCTAGSFQFDALVDITRHYHQESADAQRNANLKYITLSGRAELSDAEEIAPRDFHTELSIEQDALITMTIGNPHKNSWGGDDSYLHVIGKALTDYPNVHHILLAHNTDPLRIAITEAYPHLEGRVHSVGPTTEIIAAIKGSDLYLNSYPMGGALSTLDAILSGVPVVFNPAHLLWFDMPEWTVSDGDSYGQILNGLLADESRRARARSEQAQLYREMLSPKQVIAQYEELFSSLSPSDRERPTLTTKFDIIAPRSSDYIQVLDSIEAAISE